MNVVIKHFFFLEVDVKYTKDLHDFHDNLPFLPERMETNKCSKLICNLYDKNKYLVLIRMLINHWLILRKFHRVIQFNQKAWLKEYIGINTKLRT